MRNGADEGGQVGFYSFDLSPKKELLIKRKQSGNKGDSYPNIFTAKATEAELTQPDEVIEFGAVGDHLVARLGGGFVKLVSDSHLRQGKGYISAGGASAIRDIEVINLDGLPEAEALRLLGVDEQGNDLRGKDGAAGPPAAADSRRSLQTADVAPSDPVRALASAPTPASATKDAPFVNTLGMKFVPVPITGGPTDKQRVLFSVWETRVQDYEMFVKETGREWGKSKFEQGATHPAVMVSWADAAAFCIWLTERERKAGKLGANEHYRLPSDHEWSCAAGIGGKEDASTVPMQKSNKLIDRFSWGSTWPPASAVENFSGLETDGHKTWEGQQLIAGYNDAWPTTAPVGSFAASPMGLFDIGGNVREWCLDNYDAGKQTKVWRGASFRDGQRSALELSYRSGLLASNHDEMYGFRVVLAPAPINP